MHRVVIATLVLGLAGFDPVGAITFMGAAALGARKRWLALLGLVSVVMTAVLTTAAVLGLGPLIQRLEHTLPHPSHQQENVGILLASLVLAGWGSWRVFHRDERTESEARAPRSLGASGMTTAGLLVGASSLIDPAWYAMVTYAAGLRQPPVAVAVGLVWTVMSHILLVVLMLALLTGLYEPVQRLLDQLRTRYQREVWWLVTGLLLIGGVLGGAVGTLRLLERR